MKLGTTCLILGFAVLLAGCQSTYDKCHSPTSPGERWTIAGADNNSLEIGKHRVRIMGGYLNEAIGGRYSLLLVTPPVKLETATLIARNGSQYQGIIAGDTNRTDIKFNLDVPDGPAKEKYTLLLKGTDIDIRLEATREVIPRYIH